MDPRTILIFLVILTVLIFVHELGHFITARLTKMKVLEFGFGFPPRAFRIRHGGIDYSVNWIPFGGFVRILGEEGQARTPEGAPDPASFAGKPIPARIVVLVAGVAMNVLLAAGLYTANFMIGEPTFDGKIRWQQVEPGSPAEDAGMLPGDVVARIDGRVFYVPDEMIRYIYDRAGEPIVITVERGAQTLDVTVVPRREPPPDQGPLGLRGPEPVRELVMYAPGEAVARGVEKTGVMLQAIVRAFGMVIAGVVTGTGGADDVAGPIGILGITERVAQQGLGVVIEFAALLSLNLAIINIVPFPGLDGGRLLFVLVEAARGGRRVSPQTEAAIHAAGFVLLLGLIVVISIFDIRRLAGG